MLKQTCLTALLALTLPIATSCEKDDPQDQLEDLQEARENSPEVAQDLEQELEQAKAEVLRLEKKLALARQGVTDEVIEERAELQQALAEERQEVREEIGEAQEEAQQHNATANQARRALTETQPPARVEAEVSSDSAVVPARGEARTSRTAHTIPLEKTEVPTTPPTKVKPLDAETDTRAAKPVEQ